MKNFQKYSSYKDSGIEWLGEIPSHWEVKRLGTLGKFSASGIDKYIKKNESKVKIINFTDIFRNSNHILDNSIKYMEVTTPETNRIKHLVTRGDLIFLPSSETYEDLGLSALVNEELENTSFSYHVIKLEFEKKIEHHFKKYLTNNKFVLNQFSSFGKGTTRKIIGRNIFKNVYVIIPPLKEQQKIASFLDNKISKIDNAIKQKEKLIELLKEQKRIVINSAVTKGIDKNIELKDSGVEWIGKIPTHWEVRKFKYLLELQNNKVNIKPFHNVIALENLESGTGKFIETNSKYEGEGILFEENNILFGKLRPYLAKVYHSQENGVAFGDLLVFKSIKLVSKYAFYLLLSDGFIKIVDSSTYGTKMPRASVDYIINLILPYPPPKEQQQIVEYIEKKTKKIDNLIQLQEEYIKKLKEYKEVLINEIVTGKVKVLDE